MSEEQHMNPDPLATTARIERAARSLTSLAPLLTAGHIRPATTGTIGRVQSATSRPLPGGTEQQSLAREITETLAEWVQLLIDERDLRPTTTRHDTRGLAAIIAAHAGWLGQHDAGDECANELEAHVRAARGVIDRVPDKEYVGPCPEVTDNGACGLDLRKRPDARVARCAAGHVVDGNTTRASALAEAAQTLRSLEWIAAASPVLWGRRVTVKSLEWHIKKGRLVTTAVPGQKAHLVRVGDIDALVNHHMRQAAA